MGYKKAQPMQQAQDPLRGLQRGLDGGFRGDLSPDQIPLNSSPDLDAVRFERGAIRKDFGYRGVGVAAATAVLALGEHKFIRSDQSFHRLFRLSQTAAGKCLLEIWDGADWVDTHTSAEDIENVYLSFISSLGALLIADGERILIWIEESDVVQHNQDFPAGNLADAVGEGTSLIVSPAEAIEPFNEYIFRYQLNITGSSADGIEVTIALLHNGEEYDTRSRSHIPTTDPESFSHFTVNDVTHQDFKDGDTFEIRIKSIVFERITQTADFEVGTTHDFEATKAEAAEAEGGLYTYNFQVDAVGATLILEFFYDNGAGWISLGTLDYGGVAGDQSQSFNLPDMGAGSKFAIDKVSGTGLLTQAFEVEWEEGGQTVELHGHNEAVDGDPGAGLSYNIEGGPISTFELVSPEAPRARFVSEFAGRAIALRDGGDSQSFAWSVSGDVRDWRGEGSGQLFLVESLSDPIDSLMSFAALGSNVGALFRARSINRVVPTGNIAQAIGVVDWINEVGTESPFSVQNVAGGIAFLGHDLMVYILSEGGLRPVGQPIHQELVETLTSNLELVDSAYDPVFNEYILGVPELNSPNITKLWYLDIGALNRENNIRWRPRSLAVQRLGVSSEVL